MEFAVFLISSTTNDRAPAGIADGGPLRARGGAPYFFQMDVKSKALLISSKAPLSSAATAMPSL